MAREGVRRGAVYKPEKYCPICGAKRLPNHRCDESVLRAIDAAHNRDPDELLPFTLERPVGERLNEGLETMAQDEWSDE